MKLYSLIFLNHKETMIEKNKNIKTCNIAFLSTNYSYNLRTQLILIIKKYPNFKITYQHLDHDNSKTL